jgi:hypothetical protein
MRNDFCFCPLGSELESDLGTDVCALIVSDPHSINQFALKENKNSYGYAFESNYKRR